MSKPFSQHQNVSEQPKSAKDLRRAERSVVATLQQKTCFWIKNKSELHTGKGCTHLFTPRSLQTHDLYGPLRIKNNLFFYLVGV